MTTTSRTGTKKTPLLLGNGDVESLLCCTILEQEFTSGIRIRHVRTDNPNGIRMEECARRQASLLEVDLEEGRGVAAHPHSIQILIDGLLNSAPNEFIVWPIRCGPDPDAVAARLEEAQHLAKACALATGTDPRPIDTPLIDLDETQILDMALDLGAPLGASWPCEGGSPSACGTCRRCNAWREASKRLGREWPWGELQAVQ
jgi:hypothetical protein